MLKSLLPDANLKSLQALCASTPDGCIVEVGVYNGGSAWALNEVAAGRTLHLYDTFCGIPEQSPGDNLSIGAFKEADLASLLKALPDAQVHVGVFPATLTDDVKDIAFVHVDCDQYATCKAAIELLWPRMVNGGIMAFDDWPFESIRKAVNDYFRSVQFTDANIPYIKKEESK